MELKVGIILPKLDTNAAPGPSGLRNAHIRLWAYMCTLQGLERYQNAIECRVHRNVTNVYVQVSLLQKHPSLKRGASSEELE